MKVTPEDVKNEIVKEDYYVFPGSTTTVCLLTLRNGMGIVGSSGCVDDKNFNAEIGRTVARKRAEDQIWMLLGFRLRDKMNLGDENE